MNKKGFTLIEVLAVIIILSIIAIITTTVVSHNIKSSREDAYNIQINQIIKAARSYMLEHVNYLPEECFVISIDDLIRNGNIKSENYDEITDKYYVINPKNDEPLVGEVWVVYNEKNNQYDYEFMSNTGGNDCYNK